MKTVVVIPCHNEEATIQDIVTEAKHFADEVIVVNDHSTDCTVFAANLAGATVISPDDDRKGAGHSIWFGLCYAKSLNPDIVITLDGDGQHKPDEIPLIWPAVQRGDADIVIGSRFLNNYRIAGYRKLGIDAVNWLYNLGHKKITDTQSGFRVYNRKALECISITENGWGWSTETLIKARSKRLRIVEAPISCIYFTKSHRDTLPRLVKRGLQHIYTILKWRTKLELANLLRLGIYKIVKGVVAPPIRFLGLSGSTTLKKLYKRFIPIITPDMDKILEFEGYRLRATVDRHRDAIGVGQLLIFSKSYDPTATKIVKSILKPGMKIIDVGANIGYYTLLASTLVKDTGTVWAFEPEPINYNGLIENITLNSAKNIIPIKMAVGKFSGTAQLHISPISGGMHSLLTDRNAKGQTLNVPITTLDDYFPNEIIDFLKTDTEGNDLAVLESAKQLIARSPNIKVLFEFWLDGLPLLGINTAYLLHKIRQLGLTYIYLINERARRVELADDIKIVKYSRQHGEGCNLFCTKTPYEGAIS